MLRGLYTAAAGMISQQRRHDAITNNISNVNTPGYKQKNTELRSFPEMLISRISEGTSSSTVPVGHLNMGVLAEENVSSFMQGSLQETKQPFDLALVSHIAVPGQHFDSNGKGIKSDGTVVYQPQAFFTVLDGRGTDKYTRNGKFSLNDAGQLVTAEGYAVLGRDHQPITLVDPTTQTPLSNVKITNDGTILNNGQALTDSTGQPMGLLLSRVDNPNSLVPIGNSLFQIDPKNSSNIQAVQASDQVNIQQGYIERSNVDSTQSMVDMMDALRAYESNQQVIQYYDRSLGLAVNQVGKV